MKSRIRKGMELAEALLSPVAGLLIQMVLYALMGVRVRDVSFCFIAVMWVLLSAATAIALERLKYRAELR